MTSIAEFFETLKYVFLGGTFVAPIALFLKFHVCGNINMGESIIYSLLGTSLLWSLYSIFNWIAKKTRKG